MFYYCDTKFHIDIAGKFGGGKAWRIDSLEHLAKESLVN